MRRKAVHDIPNMVKMCRVMFATLKCAAPDERTGLRLCSIHPILSLMPAAAAREHMIQRHARVPIALPPAATTCATVPELIESCRKHQRTPSRRQIDAPRDARRIVLSVRQLLAYNVIEVCVSTTPARLDNNGCDNAREPCTSRSSSWYKATRVWDDDSGAALQSCCPHDAVVWASLQLPDDQ